MSTFIIACGGTGGHLSPGIALAENLKKNGHKCILITSRKNVDKVLSQSYQGFFFIQFPGIGFSKNIFKWPRFFYFQCKNFLYSFHLIRTNKVDAVIGFGGFLNAGVVLAAFCLRKLCFLHEANRVPGKAIRFLSHFAKRIYLPDGVQLKTLFSKTILNCGMPIRNEIRKVDQNEAKKQLNFNPLQKLVVVIGGSQGASSFNKWVIDHFEKLNNKSINVLCITGLNKGKAHSIEKMNVENVRAKVTFIPFYNQMHLLYSAADLVISRAGAGTLAELAKCGTPSIIIPYPHAAENHQMANAIYFEQRGCCLMLEEKNIENLLSATLHLLATPNLLKKLSHNLVQFSQSDAAGFLAQDIESFFKD